MQYEVNSPPLFLKQSLLTCVMGTDFGCTVSVPITLYETLSPEGIAVPGIDELDIAMEGLGFVGDAQ